MAKKEYFDSKMAWFFKKSGCISVDRENHGGTSKEIALDILNNGYANEGVNKNPISPILVAASIQ